MASVSPAGNAYVESESNTIPLSMALALVIRIRQGTFWPSFLINNKQCKYLLMLRKLLHYFPFHAALYFCNPVTLCQSSHESHFRAC
jgi:hypothetical protein